jgi:hypothetical protein
MSTVEVWLIGGPAAGAFRDVLVDDQGQPPATLTLTEPGALVGSNDRPGPASEHLYELVRDAGGQLPEYHFRGTVPAGT